MIDLHLHSTCSDGQDTPEELVQRCFNTGITTMALTDHDTINGLTRAKGAAERLDVEFINGIEISVQGGRELHILGYGVDENSQELKKFYEDNRIHRIERRDRLIKLFNRAGIPITLEKICEVNDGKSTGRPHIARTLVEMEYAHDVQDAFDRYLRQPEYYCAERPKPTACDGIGMIVRAGGLPVLAHPYLLGLDDNALRRLIKKLMSYGLQGMECYYSKHTPEASRYYRGIADEYGLISTLGSDYHGPDIKPEIQPGTGCDGSLERFACFGEEIKEKLLQKIKEFHK